MQFNKVVVAVDFSAASLAAARWVAMQLAPRAEVVLVHVVREPATPSFVRPHLPPFSEIVAELTPALHGALRGLAGVIGSARTSVKLLMGTPADALATFGRETGADLICLGRRQRRRGAARFGHTTAQRLLAQTRMPVLVVPTARPTLPARILVPIDDEPGCCTDLREAWGLAQTCEAALEILHVLAPELPRLVSLGLADRPASVLTEVHTRTPIRVEALDSPGDVDDPVNHQGPADLYLRGKARLELLTHEWLASQMRQVSHSARRVASHVRVGDPGEQIVRFMHAAGVDLVTIGRGRGDTIANASVKSAEIFSLGSTSRLVLWASPCPVLVLPPTPQPAEPEPSPRSEKRRLHLDTNMRRPLTTSPSSPRMATPDDYPPAARQLSSPQSGMPGSAA
jgi:nucleotide-binding universal stress UspA family protein